MLGSIQNIFQQVGATLVPPKPPAPASTGVHVLRLTAEQGYRHFPARQGQVIGPTERYKIVRMLGCVGHIRVFFLLKTSGVCHFEWDGKV